jgi:hypothetical protein
MAQYFYDKQLRRYIQQFIRLFGGFNVQMGSDNAGLPIYQKVPVRYGDINRMAAHITRENSENIVNTVPLISCYVTDLNMAPERRLSQDYVEKVQVAEKKINHETGTYENEIGRTYTVERHMPVPYNLVMNCDVWTSNTDQKLQLLEQILVLFNPTLNINTSSNPLDWSSLSYVEMTNTLWSSRSIGSTIDDIIDVSTLTFQMPVLINPPAKVKQQKLIHTLINELYSLDDTNLDLFKENLPFDETTLKYTVVTFEQRKLRFENGNAFLLTASGEDNNNGTILSWKDELENFGELRSGISQIRLRKSDDPGDIDNDIVGTLSFDPQDDNILIVDVDQDTLPANTISPIDGVIDPTIAYPGSGNVPVASQGQRYMVTKDTIGSGPWGGVVANTNDIIEYNGTNWVVSFDSKSNNNQQYLLNNASQDQLEWNGKEWYNSYEGIYKQGYWRLYL